MEKKTNELLQESLRIMGNDSDLLILCHKDEQCGAVIHGKTDKVAQAIFSCMHQPGNPTGQALYEIIKLIVVNTLRNPSPFAQNLIDAINNVIPDEDE